MEIPLHGKKHPAWEKTTKNITVRIENCCQITWGINQQQANKIWLGRSQSFKIVLIYSLKMTTAQSFQQEFFALPSINLQLLCHVHSISLDNDMNNPVSNFLNAKCKIVEPSHTKKTVKSRTQFFNIYFPIDQQCPSLLIPSLPPF